MTAILGSLVVGCAAVPSAPKPDATVTPSPTSTAEPIARPAAQWDVDCPQLVPDATLDTVVRVGLVADDFYARPWVGFTTSAAILQAGGIVCNWRAESAPGDTWRLTVLPDSIDGFQADFDYLTGLEYGAWTSVEAFDGAAAYCSGGTKEPGGIRCQWIALSGTRYITLDFREVRKGEVENPDPAPNPDTSIPPLRPSGSATIALLGGVFSAIEAAPVVDLEPLQTAAPGCADLLTRKAVAGALGVDASEVKFARAQDDPDAPLAAIGGSSCFAVTDDLYIQATLAPGLGWTIDRALAEDPEVSAGPLVGLDSGVVKCVMDEEGQPCVSAVVDPDGVLLSVTVSSTGGAAPTRKSTVALLSVLAS